MTALETVFAALGASGAALAILAAVRGQFHRHDAQWALDGWQRACVRYEDERSQMRADYSHWVDHTIDLERDLEKARAEALDYKSRWGSTMRQLGIAQRANHAMRHGKVDA